MTRGRANREAAGAGPAAGRKADRVALWGPGGWFQQESAVDAGANCVAARGGAMGGYWVLGKALQRAYLPLVGRE